MTFLRGRRFSVMSWSRDLPITWSWHMTTHMISSHDPDTWDQLILSRHRTYKLHPDIKSSSIPISASWLHPSLSSVIQLLHLLIITARVVCPSSKNLVWTSSRGALEARKEGYFKINASPGIRWWWLDRGKVP